MAATCPCRNGICVSELGFENVCLCNPGFTGRADYFDLRVFVNGTFELSLDCTVPTAATDTMWGIFLFIYTTRFLLTIISLIVLVPRKRIRPLIRNLMIFDIFATLLAISVPIQKFVDGSNSVFGTSIPATVCQVFGNLFMMIVWSVAQIEEFKLVTNIRHWYQYKENKLAMFHLKLHISFIFTYFMSCVISLCAISLDKTLGPIANNEVVILILRNASIFIWTIFLVIGVSKVQDREKSTRILLLHTPGAERSGRVVDYLEKSKSHMKKQAFIGSTLYLVFSIPPLWDWQFLNIAVTSIILALTSSLGTTLLRSEYAAASSSNSNQHSNFISKKEDAPSDNTNEKNTADTGPIKHRYQQNDGVVAAYHKTQTVSY